MLEHVHGVLVGDRVGVDRAMTGNNATSYLNELNCAKAIKGITFKPEPDHKHVSSPVTYGTTPPIGGQPRSSMISPTAAASG